MQLMIGVAGSWKCVSVSLMEGCVPCIGGVSLPDENIEPALWFKVVVLSSVFVDCSDRIISWCVHDGDSAVNNSVELNLLQSGSPQPTSPIPLPSSHHSLMAPAEGSRDSLLCTNDLQSLFELAEVLYRVSMPLSSGLSDSISRASQVECKSWLRLLHCYLLPVISLHCDDIVMVERAHTQHLMMLDNLDQTLHQLSDQRHQVKETLSEMLDDVTDKVADWVERKQCSHKFISLIASDLKHREENARGKIQSSLRKLEMSGHLDAPMQSGVELKIASERKEGEQILFQSLMLRSFLEGVVSLGDPSERLHSQGENHEIQQNYIQLHRKLEDLRSQSATLSKKKVLSLSVREALEQTLQQLRHGKRSTGLDVSLQGGHSTDVLPEASRYCANNEYLTLKDKVHKLIQIRSTTLSKEHNSFCQTLRTHLAGKTQPDTQQLLHSVHQHFNQIVELICTHFNDHDQDFMQRARLCYEQMFFEIFITCFLQLYQNKHAKYCEQLALNSLGASLVDPLDRDLGLSNTSWGNLFSARSFEEAEQLYEDIQNLSLDSVLVMAHQPNTKHFEGVIADLVGLFSANSPLDQLQFLTSAFRKAMAALSHIKLKPLLEIHAPDQVDASLAAISFDELLPVLVLVLMECVPSFLAKLHVHCAFLSDYMPPFLSPGWHGYSLAAFTSALHIISKL